MLFENGIASRDRWTSLFHPNDIIVTLEKDQPLAYLLETSPRIVGRSLVLNLWSWGFDGHFYKQSKEFQFHWPSSSDTIPISELQAYPLRYNRTGLEKRLRRRGRIFWTCRWKRFVSYDVPHQGLEVQQVSLTIVANLDLI